MRTTYLSAAALAVPLALFTAGPAAADESATVELDVLNNSNATGTAELFLDEETNMLTVNIDSQGLVPNLPHAQHIHIGGQNICPPASVAGEDGIINTPEGQPFYGGIQLSLTTEGDFSPGSALALERFPVASADGAVSYERTFDLSQIEGDINLADVSIVQHGIDSISPNGEYGPPPPVSALDPSLPLEGTAPANCGATDQMGQMPMGGVDAGAGGTAGVENEALFALGAAGLVGAGALAYRRRAARGDV